MNGTNETNKKSIHYFFKKGFFKSFNKIKSIVAFKMSELVMISNDT